MSYAGRRDTGRIAPDFHSRIADLNRAATFEYEIELKKPIVVMRCDLESGLDSMCPRLLDTIRA
jgi:hypothetical protein